MKKSKMHWPPNGERLEADDAVRKRRFGEWQCDEVGPVQFRHDLRAGSIVPLADVKLSEAPFPLLQLHVHQGVEPSVDHREFRADFCAPNPRQCVQPDLVADVAENGNFFFKFRFRFYSHFFHPLLLCVVVVVVVEDEDGGRNGATKILQENNNNERNGTTSRSAPSLYTKLFDDEINHFQIHF